MRRSIARLLRRFRRDRKGVSAVEFALIAPLLIACYFGLAEMCGAMLAERKASQIASEMGDLVAQGSTINTAGITDIFSVANTVMVPMPTTTLNLRISSITADSTGKIYTVAWTKTQGNWSTTVATGQTVTVPAGLLAANGDIIRSEVQYTYASPVADFIKTPVTFNEVFYLAPRQSAAVVWQAP
jgi:Flp pilus assembly protein TadG